MKRLAIVLSVILVFSTMSWAQMGGGMMGSSPPQQQEQQQQNPWGYGGYGMGPGMMGGYGGYGYGMGPGMMGGYGMGPGMMGGYGHMGPGMMGGYGACGMGPGMMGGYGHGMGPGMMGGYGHMGPGMMGGYGYGMGPGMMYNNNPQMQKFLDETRDMRKELSMKQFEYFEAMRDPKASPENVEKLRKEMMDLNSKIYEKAPR